MDACKATSSVAVEVPSDAFFDVPLDTTVYETAPGMHSTTVDNNRVQVLADGKYDAFGAATFETAGGAIRQLALQKNGTNVGGITVGVKSDVPVSGYLHSLEVNGKGVEMLAGDWFNLVAYQDSGAPVNIISGNGELSPILYVIKVN